MQVPSNIADCHESLKKCCSSFEKCLRAPLDAVPLNADSPLVWAHHVWERWLLFCMTICHANEPSLHTAKQWDNAQSKISLEIKTNLLVSMETTCWHQHKRNQWLSVVYLARGEEHLGQTYRSGRQRHALQSHSKGRWVIEKPRTKCHHTGFFFFLPIIYFAVVK